MARSQARSSAGTRAVAILLCVMVCMVDSFAAAVNLNVGGRAGWTIQHFGHMNARRGDQLFFNYNPKFHDVLQVSQAEYNKCLVPSRPMKKYSSGKDNIRLNSPGTFFFICGVPGHCSSGMKLAVTVH